MGRLSPYTWGWVAMGVPVILTGGLWYLGSLTQIDHWLVVVGFMLFAIGFSWLDRLAKEKGLANCPACGLDSNIKNGESGYKPAIAFFPQTECSRCGCNLKSTLSAVRKG